MIPIRITDLRCEYLVAPLGIDETAPRLSWRLESPARGLRQVAYRVRVAATPEKLAAGHADLWDTGRVESAATTQIAYAGVPLPSRQRCHWQVEVWPATDAAPAGGNAAPAPLPPVVSAPSFWTMGLLEPSDWTAKWIAADPGIIRRDSGAIAATLTEPGTPALFRREFEIPGGVTRATLYASARGVFELRANGHRVGDDLFAPEWTDYRKRIHYRTYDVTSLVTSGANCLAATLGDGWWSGYVGWQETRARYGSLENSLVLQLEVQLADGSRITLGTDATWTCNTGPILSSDFMMGEAYDARRERTGWDRPAEQPADATRPGKAGIDPVAPAAGHRPTVQPADVARPGRAGIGDWLPAREVAAPAARLVAQGSERVHVIETLRPEPAGRPPPGGRLYDLGQNIAGWVQLRLHDFPAGMRITLRHGERLTAEGALYTENLRRAKATDVYITRGGPLETWHPHFTFHGFQYVEVTFDPPPPPTAVLVPIACAIHSATPPAGRFECSHPGVNRLWRNALWSQKDNFLSVPTDCPQRDERLGWMGDAQVFLRTATCNMDVAAFFTKWMVDVEDAQTPEGIFPDVAPRIPEDVRFVGLDDLGGAAGWADAGIIVPWTIWRVYGDRRIIERHWRAMVAWLDYLERTNPDGLRTRALHNNYGDWLCIPTDTSFRTHSPMKNLLATAYWADDAAKMARMARAIGREADAARFQATFEKIRSAFQREWLLPDGRLKVETQTAYLLALAFDLLPAGLRAAAAGHLVGNIRALGWHLSTGFIGISHLNPQLTLAGHNDVAYRLLLQDTFPSWLYPVKHGATTIWERWNGWTHDDGFFNPQMNSFNHYSLGSVGEWLFRHVAGIELDPEVPGYARFVLRPHPGEGLAHAGASLRTMHGEIVSRWRIDGKEFSWEVVVPPNTTARIFVPAATESAARADGLAPEGHDGHFALFNAPAGRYRFTSTLS
ncbi:MAG TPA: family 78 glycoside hydrolase catalytic domain [Opitutaceae bacterium]|nr:family 78 glycoside hydrolase catalytic domain [Opitutaceae bacterium]